MSCEIQYDESRTQGFHLFRWTEILVHRNAVLGQLPKRLLFTMIKNKYFLGSLDTNPYYFNHFNISHFTLFYNGKSIPS